MTLEEALGQVGWTLSALFERGPVALVGSRACGCAREDSDWDVVVLGKQELTVRAPGLDLMWEDPPNDRNWPIRDQAFHMTGYAKWLSGGPNWEPSVLDWEGAIAKKKRRLVTQIATVQRVQLGRFLDKHVRKIRADLQRLVVLQRHEYIPATAMMLPLSDEDLSDFEIGDDLRRRLRG